MKNLLILVALTFLPIYPALASEPPTVFDLELEKPRTVEQQQLEEYQKQSNEQIRQFNADVQESLNQTYENKVQWQGVLGEIQDRQIGIERDRNARPPRIPTRFMQ